MEESSSSRDDTVIKDTTDKTQAETADAPKLSVTADAPKSSVKKKLSLEVHYVERSSTFEQSSMSCCCHLYQSLCCFQYSFKLFLMSLLKVKR